VGKISFKVGEPTALNFRGYLNVCTITYTLFFIQIKAKKYLFIPYMKVSPNKIRRINAKIK